MPVLRSITRAPGLAATVTGMLTLTTAALATAFTLVDAAILRPPPFPAADRVAMLYSTRTTTRDGTVRQRWSFPEIQVLREWSPVIGTIANYTPALLTLAQGDEPEAVPGEVASASYFPLLGGRALVGRTFSAEEDSIARPAPVVVLGHDLWRRRFAGDAGVVGQAVRINGLMLTVIGVMRPGFRGLSGTADLWIPTVMAPHLTYPEYLTTPQHFINVVARIRLALSMDEAAARTAIIGARIGAADLDPDADAGELRGATAVPLNVARVASTTRQSLLLLLSAVAILHLLACANVINLLLARAIARRREAAIISAIGGGWSQRLRHFGLEGVVLVAVGCGLGLALAYAVSPLVTAPAETWGPRNFYGSLAPFAHPIFGWRSAAFGLAVTLGTVVLVTWAPTMALMRTDVIAGLRAGATVAGTAGTLRRPSVRGVLVAVEAGLATILLVAGGLMLDSFRRMTGTDLGVNAEGVLTFWVRPPEARVPTDAAPAFVARLLEAIKAVPGVTAATVDGGAPVSGSARSTLYIVGRESDVAPPVLRHYIAPDHFHVLGVPLRRGRVFSEGDIAGRPRVAIISQSAALRFWPDQDPLGQRVWFGGGSNFNSPDRSAEIVGVVGDVVYEPLGVGENRADFYTPYAQFTYSSRMVMVRTTGDPLSLVGSIRRAVSRVDPDLPLVEVQTLQQLVRTSWSRTRFDALFLGTFAALGALLAGAGIYAVAAFAVSQRIREMGIRMALGATPDSIVRLVVREGLMFPAVGLLSGGVASLMVTRVLRASLYQVAPGDLTVLGVMILALFTVALVACYLPARRATRVDPVRALKAE